MNLKIIFNPFTGKFQYVNTGTATPTIPEYTSDPVSPTPEETWVLHPAGPTMGSPIGLLLSLTYTNSVPGPYLLSYYTTENTIKRVALT